MTRFEWFSFLWFETLSLTILHNSDCRVMVDAGGCTALLQFANACIACKLA